MSSFIWNKQLDKKNPDVGHVTRSFGVDDNLDCAPALDDRTTDFRLCSSAAASTLASNSSLLIATFRAWVKNNFASRSQIFSIK